MPVHGSTKVKISPVIDKFIKNAIDYTEPKKNNYTLNLSKYRTLENQHKQLRK